MMKKSPVLLFVYNRPSETLKTLDSLKKCSFSEETDLYIFSDNAKSEKDKILVDQVREIVSSFTGFKTITVNYANKNKGLAKSIIDGVSSVIVKFGKVIVLEDDLLCSKDFLIFMNNSLLKHERSSKIGSISGYSPKLVIDDPETQTYLAPRCCSWGWATWKDRWDNIDWNMKYYKPLSKSKNEIDRFNEGGNDLFEMLKLQYYEKIDSWAIRWCYHLFSNNMYTIYPFKSKIMNIGIKAGGTHANSNDSRWDVDISNESIDVNLPPMDYESIKPQFLKSYNLDLVGKIGYFLKLNGLYQYFISYKKIFRK